MNANFGLVDDLPTRVRDKRQKREMIAERALGEMVEWVKYVDRPGSRLENRTTDEGRGTTVEARA